ncbi:MAG: DUF2520 domain-containing protein [Flavobacteriaceae bacterium]|nr:DUF2520 domain-containing protein [Flavobacteriaceae bacterium]
MIKVVIIGTGNVATHLVAVFKKVDTLDVKQINSRKLESIPSSAITIIAVADDAIKEVSAQLANRTGLIVHTSGTVAMSALFTARTGVFYSLQSFTKGTAVNFMKVPFCLEATNDEDLQLLISIVSSIGAKAYPITTEQRKKLHIAAVFVNNFTNHMYEIGNEICEKREVPFEILYPLIEETAKKIQSIPPKNAQTGPAKRNDSNTIKNHLEQLNSQQQAIYHLLTKSIQVE